MARASAIQTGFNAGEVSPRLYGRVDTQVYRDGARTLLGWLPTVQGPAIAAPGTIFVDVAKGPFRALPFEYDTDQAYVVEASAGTFRFYANDGRLGGDAPIEVAHPYSYDEVRVLDYQQSLDVMYLFHGSHQQRKLERRGAAQFDCVPFDLTGGPYEDGNADQTLTVTASATTGTVTLTASSALFVATDVGSLFEIEAGDFGGISMWEPGISVDVGTIRTWNGRVYQSGSGTGRTGTVPPVHDAGVEWDGMGSGSDVNGKTYGTPWTYLYNRYGHVRITGYVSPTQVSASVIDRIATTDANWRWAFGAFSDTRGWPSAGTIWRQRLVLAKGDELFGSVTGDFGNFAARDSSGNAQRDLAFRATLPNPDAIKWLAADTRLVVGTARSEHAVEQVDVQTGVAGPPILNASCQSTFGTAAIRPVLADGNVLFVQRAGRKLLELAYAIEADRYKGTDTTSRADHIGALGFVELAWQQEPDRHLWAVRGDGSLAALLYEREQGVAGWARRTLANGLAARTVAAIDAPDGRGQQLWLGAERSDGSWWILRMGKLWEIGDAAADAQFLDAALTYTGQPVAAGGGAAHLAGMTVQVLADGKPHRDIVVGATGTWQIDYPASTVTLGLPFTATLEMLPIEAGGEDGTAQGKLKRIPSVTLRLIETQGISIAVDGAEVTPQETRVPTDAMDQAVPLFSGDVKVTTVGLTERQGIVRIDRTQPTPATVVAVMPVVNTGSS